MIIAKRDIKMGDGSIRKAGQPVPEAISWKYSVLRVLLSNEYLEDKDGEIAKKYAWGTSVKKLTQDVPSSKVVFECCGKIFKNDHGLKLHKARMHRG